jgi:hypothetical protein
MNVIRRSILIAEKLNVTNTVENANIRIIPSIVKRLNALSIKAAAKTAVITATVTAAHSVRIMMTVIFLISTDAIHLKGGETDERC